MAQFMAQRGRSAAGRRGVATWVMTCTDAVVPTAAPRAGLALVDEGGLIGAHHPAITVASRISTTTAAANRPSAMTGQPVAPTTAVPCAGPVGGGGAVAVWVSERFQWASMAAPRRAPGRAAAGSLGGNVESPGGGRWSVRPAFRRRRRWCRRNRIRRPGRVGDMSSPLVAAGLW